MAYRVARRQRAALILFCALSTSLEARAASAAFRVEDVDASAFIANTDIALAPGGEFAVVEAGYGVVYGTWDGVTWRAEIADAEVCVADSPSLGFDPAGEPAIAYFDRNAGQLRLARRAGAVWTVEVVDSTSRVGRFPSLAFDPTGEPVISYTNESLGYLNLARSTAGTWSIERVDPGPAGDTALVLDAAGRPRIAYGGPSGVRLASWDGTVWIRETVDPTGGEYISLKLDRSGNPAMSYGSFPVRFARFDGTTWSLSVVDPAGDGSLFTSLALDASDRPLVLYRGADRYPHLGRWTGSTWATETVATQRAAHGALVLSATASPTASLVIKGDLVVASLAGATWSSTQLVPGGDVGSYPSLALDAAGMPWVSYHDATELTPRLAHFDGATWVSETVEPGGFNVKGSHTSLAFDADGKPAIAYAATSPNEIRLARFNGATWAIDRVDAGYGYTSLRFDAAGLPLLSYYDWGATVQSLRFARFDGTSWRLETVDSGSYVGSHTSLAIDPAGNPAISYCDEGAGTPKLARWNGTAWVLDTIPAPPESGRYSSLAFDRVGNPVVSFQNSFNADLFVARHDGTAWRVVLVDSGGSVGWDTSLAVDRAGNPRVSYRDWQAGLLKLARWDGAAWRTEAVTDVPLGFHPGGTSIAIDAADNTLIAFYGGCRGKLQIAREENNRAVFRGTVASLIPGWRATALPLTSLNDDETAPFPLAVVLPGSAEDDLPTAAGLTLYRVLASGDADLGNRLLAVKAAGGVALKF